MNNLKKITWICYDDLYAIVKKYNLKTNIINYSQYPGGEKYYINSWKKHIIGSFPKDVISSDKQKLIHTPQKIITCFQKGDVLSALVLIILWGSMVRTKNKIYTVDLHTLRSTLKKVDRIIRTEGDIKKAWMLIRHQLNWSNVILSKYLHFAVRSYGYENPPVPIDNLIIRNQFWPEFKKYFKKHKPHNKLISWFDKDYSWEAYNNYMTVILALSDKYKVNTTRIENIIFGFYNNK